MLLEWMRDRDWLCTSPPGAFYTTTPKPGPTKSCGENPQSQSLHGTRKLQASTNQRPDPVLLLLSAHTALAVYTHTIKRTLKRVR